MEVVPAPESPKPQKRKLPTLCPLNLAKKEVAIQLQHVLDEIQHVKRMKMSEKSAKSYHEVIQKNTDTLSKLKYHSQDVEKTQSLYPLALYTEPIQTFDLEDLAKDREKILKEIYDIKMTSGRPLPAKIGLNRPRTHWDNLLDEMKWMAIDFFEEGVWKVSVCKEINKEYNEFIKNHSNFISKAKEKNEIKIKEIDNYNLINIPFQLNYPIIEDKNFNTQNNKIKEIISTDDLLEVKISEIIQISESDMDKINWDKELDSYTLYPQQKDGINFICSHFQQNLPVIFNSPKGYGTHSLFAMLLDYMNNNKGKSKINNKGENELPNILIVNDKDVEYYEFICCALLEASKTVVLEKDIDNEKLIIYADIIICPQSLIFQNKWLTNSYFNLLIVDCNDLSGYLPYSNDMSECLLFSIRLNSRYVIIRSDVADNQQVQLLSLLFPYLINDPLCIKNDALSKLYSNITYRPIEIVTKATNYKNKHIRNIKVELTDYQENLFHTALYGNFLDEAYTTVDHIKFISYLSMLHAMSSQPFIFIELWRSPLVLESIEPIKPFIYTLLKSKYDELENINLYNYGLMLNAYDYTDNEYESIQKLNPVQSNNMYAYQYTIDMNILRCDANKSTLPSKIKVALSIYLNIPIENIYSRISLFANNTKCEINITVILEKDKLKIDMNEFENKLNEYFDQGELAVYINQLGIDFDSFNVKIYNRAKYNNIILKFNSANDYAVNILRSNWKPLYGQDLLQSVSSIIINKPSITTSINNNELLNNRIYDIIDKDELNRYNSMAIEKVYCMSNYHYFQQYEQLIEELNIPFYSPTIYKDSFLPYDILSNKYKEIDNIVVENSNKNLRILLLFSDDVFEESITDFLSKRKLDYVILDQNKPTFKYDLLYFNFSKNYPIGILCNEGIDFNKAENSKIYLNSHTIVLMHGINQGKYSDYMCNIENHINPLIDYKFYRVIAEGTLDDYIIYDNTISSNCYNNNPKFLEKIRKNHNLPSRKVLHYFYEDNNYCKLDESPWIIVKNEIIKRYDTNLKKAVEYVSCNVSEIFDNINSDHIPLDNELIMFNNNNNNHYISKDTLFYNTNSNIYTNNNSNGINSKKFNNEFDILNEYCFEMSKINIPTIPHLYGPPDPLINTYYDDKDKSNDLLQYIVSFNETSNSNLNNNNNNNNNNNLSSNSMNMNDDIYMSGRRSRNRKKPTYDKDDIYTYGGSSDDDTILPIPKSVKSHNTVNINNLLPPLPGRNNNNLWTKLSDSVLLWCVKEYGKNWELICQLLVKYNINKGSLCCKNRYEKLSNEINCKDPITCYNKNDSVYTSDVQKLYNKKIDSLLSSDVKELKPEMKRIISSKEGENGMRKCERTNDDEANSNKYKNILNTFDSILRINQNHGYRNCLYGLDLMNSNNNNNNISNSSSNSSTNMNGGVGGSSLSSPSMNINSGNSLNERTVTPSAFLDDFYTKKKEIPNINMNNNSSNVLNPSQLPTNIQNSMSNAANVTGNNINMNNSTNNNGVYYQNIINGNTVMSYDNNMKTMTVGGNSNNSNNNNNNNIRRMMNNGNMMMNTNNNNNNNASMSFQQRNNHHLQTISPKLQNRGGNNTGNSNTNNIMNNNNINLMANQNNNNNVMVNVGMNMNMGNSRKMSKVRSNRNTNRNMNTANSNTMGMNKMNLNNSSMTIQIPSQQQMQLQNPMNIQGVNNNNMILNHGAAGGYMNNNNNNNNQQHIMSPTLQMSPNQLQVPSSSSSSSSSIPTQLQHNNMNQPNQNHPIANNNNNNNNNNMLLSGMNSVSQISMSLQSPNQSPISLPNQNMNMNNRNIRNINSNNNQGNSVDLPIELQESVQRIIGRNDINEEEKKRQIALLLQQAETSGRR